MLKLIWGKTSHNSDSNSVGVELYHPLILHLIDVAVITSEIWDCYLAESTRQLIRSELELSENDTRAWISFLAGMHDIGKCTPEFQRKSEPFRLSLAKAGLQLYQASNKPVPHGLAGGVILKQMLENRFQMPRASASVWARVAGGHHGEFPKDLTAYQEPCVYGDPRWSGLRDELLQALTDVCHATNVPQLKPKTSSALVIAGLISVADWLASNQRYFPCSTQLEAHGSNSIDLKGYSERSRQQGRQALLETGWRTVTKRPGPNAEDLSSKDNSPFTVLFHGMVPRPSQMAVEAATKNLNEPAIVILEAPTGEGKTEAALILADHLAQVAGQRGIYFALPTQATSNQMFGRVCKFLSKRFAGEPAFPAMLSHSHAMLSPDMLELLRREELIVHLASVGEDPKDEIYAAEWFTKPKRGLLAPFGVGTVDQALMSALITRHVFVRLFGLSGKVVIIDEVHAYDTYMSELLKRLLEWLGALQSSVILLSATLPRKRRDELLASWARGAGQQLSIVTDAAYPRLSIVARDGKMKCQSLPVSERSVRTVQLSWVAQEQILATIARKIASGGCAAILCNTVRVAQDLFRELLNIRESLSEAERPLLILFHARFPYEERLDIEERVLRSFGPDAAERPTRAVLVATQVVEQSLDLDFDVMASELAPADLVLQRAGRLYRHQRIRANAFQGPELILIDPPAAPDGSPQFSAPNRYVYDEYILLKTWLALRMKQQISTPGETEYLIESVYDEQPANWGEGTMRDRLATSHLKIIRERENDENEAANGYIPLPSTGDLPSFTSNPREEDRPDLPPRFQAKTRNSEPSVTCVCLYQNQERFFLDSAFTNPVDLKRHPTGADTRQFLLRSLTLSDKKLLPALLLIDIPHAWRKNTILRYMRPIFLDSQHMGTLSAPGHEFRFKCDPIFGFELFGFDVTGNG